MATLDDNKPDIITVLKGIVCKYVASYVAILTHL